MISARVLLWALFAFLSFGALAFLAVIAVVCRWFKPRAKKPDIEPVRPIHRP